MVDREEFAMFDTLLSDDQEGMVKYFLNSGNGISVLGTGLGKTYGVLSSFAAFRGAFESYCLLVVGSKNSMTVWGKETARRTPYSISLYTSQNKRELDPNDSDIYATQFNLIPKIVPFLEKLFSTRKVILVIDELHRAKSPITELRSSLDYLISRSVYAWGITATLMNTHLEDIYYLHELIFPGKLGTLRKFRKSYITYKERKTASGDRFSEVVGYKNLFDLRALLQETLFVRFKTMPLKFYLTEVELGSQEERKYILAAQGGLGLDYRGFVSRLPDLQQAVDNSIVEGRMINEEIDYLGTKEAKLLEMVDDLLHQDRAVIIYTFYRKTLNRLRNLFLSKLDIDAHVITGNTSDKRRSEIEDNFSNGDVLLMTGAGGESLNLQAAGVLIFYSLPFSVITFIQVVGRIARMDSAHVRMEVHIIEASDTIDEYKRMYLYSNINLVNTILTFNPNLPEFEITPSRKYIISLRRNLLWRAKKNV